MLQVEFREWMIFMLDLKNCNKLITQIDLGIFIQFIESNIDTYLIPCVFGLVFTITKVPFLPIPH